MAMNLAQISRFMSRADHTLEELFPATLRIAGLDYACTGVGGSAMLEYLAEGGQAPAGTKVFRLRKTLMATRPETGTLVQWIDSPGSVTRLTVIDSPDRPHESSWVLRCAPTDR